MHNDEWYNHKQVSKKVDEIINEDIKPIKDIDSEAIIGYRGSVATGIKFKSKKPFDPSDFDVDAFIVSDKIASNSCFRSK